MHAVTALRCMQKKLLLLGLLAYLDFADVVAKAGFDIDWERMEAPPEIICDIFDDEVIADGQRHFYSEVVGLREFDLRGETSLKRIGRDKCRAFTLLWANVKAVMMPELCGPSFPDASRERRP